MKKNGTTGQISESVVLIVFAYGQSIGKSGTDSGTNMIDRRRNRMRFRFRKLSPREKTASEITAVISCRKTLSRTPVPNLESGKRCLYWLSRSPGLCGIRQRFCTHGESTPAVPRDRPGLRLGSERRSTDPQSGLESPTKPVSRPVCGREQREHGRERETGSEGGKTPVFLSDSGRFPPDL